MMMRMMMAVLAAGTLVLAAAGATAGPFWPLAVGQHAEYTDGTGIVIEARSQANSATYWQHGAGVNCRNHFLDGADGDIYAVGGSGTGATGSCSWYSPVPILFLDLPLYTTKSWSTAYAGRRVRGRVEAITTAQLPDGILHCFIVTIEGLSPCLDGTWWVNETYGPVRLPGGGMLSVVPVADENPSWGVLKAAYR